MERLEPDSWKDEISCRFWWRLFKACDKVSRHKHFWGPIHHDELLNVRGRTCRLCRTFEVPSISRMGTVTTGTATNATTTYVDLDSTSTSVPTYFHLKFLP